MSEIEYYEEFSKKFTDYINTYLGKGYKTFYTCNKSLDFMISDLEMQSGLRIKAVGAYVPKLKLDIVFLVVGPNKSFRLILIEAKHLNQLALKDYSQLVGYLQVAKTIEVGLLLLIQKGPSFSKLSNDFHEIILLKKLPMNWFIGIDKFQEKFLFKTGIISYLPGNGIDWVDTTEINGISSFSDLVGLMKLGSDKEE